MVFTGGEAARFDKVTCNYNISKSLIISNFLSLMQRKRFDYSPGLEALPLLPQEISSFKYHLTPSGHTGFDAEVGAHDDLICAICIPLIIAEWQFEVPPEYDRDDSSGSYEAIDSFPGLDACFPGGLSRSRKRDYEKKSYEEYLDSW